MRIGRKRGSDRNFREFSPFLLPGTERGEWGSWLAGRAHRRRAVGGGGWRKWRGLHFAPYLELERERGRPVVARVAAAHGKSDTGGGARVAVVLGEGGSKAAGGWMGCGTAWERGGWDGPLL